MTSPISFLSSPTISDNGIEVTLQIVNRVAEVRVANEFFEKTQIGRTDLSGTDVGQVPVWTGQVWDAGNVTWDSVQDIPAVIAAGDTQQDARDAIGLGTAAVADADDFATAAQGALADTALQEGDGLAALDSAASTKLAGMAAGATANDTNANLKNRANHTGTQLANTISNFNAAASAAAPVQSVAGKTGAVALAKADVGLGSVDNTSDLSKPISTATQTALNAKIPEAPTDGKQYARKDAGWVAVAASGAGGMEASTYDPQNIADDTFDRANHTGTQPMASIGDKQGKVLDDPVIVSDGDIDSLMTPGGYLFDSNPANGFFAGAAMLVSAVDGYTFQQVFSPISGVIGMRYHDGASWLPFFLSVTLQMVKDWYDNTTYDQPNAVINADGTFSRSIATFNQNPLLVVSGASHAFVQDDVNKYARYTDDGAKTATFDSSAGFEAGDEFHITNRAASGNITISGTGVTFNAPKGGTLVLEPKDTVTVKFVSPTEADVMGSTEAA